jgi:hypothetical protein
VSKNTCEVVVGRLLEIRLGPGYLAPGDVDDMIKMIGQSISTRIAADERVVIAADWRNQRIMNPQTAERTKAMLTGVNPRVLRSSILTLPENATTNMQVVRLVRESENPERRHFTDVAAMRAWLAEILRDDERARLAQFLTT